MIPSNGPIRRNTDRKRMIRSILRESFAGGPVLLSELRWRVSFAEAALTDEPTPDMTRSRRNTLNETVRRMTDELSRYRIGPTNQIPLGVDLREAVFRMTSPTRLSRFLQEDDSTVALRWITRDIGGRVARMPEFSFWSGDIHDGTKLQFHGKLLMNSGRPVVFVSTRKPSKRLVREMGTGPWEAALVHSHPRHRIEDPRNILDQLIAEEPSREWIDPDPFESNGGYHYLYPLRHVDPGLPLRGSKNHANEGLRNWMVRYNITKMPTT